MPVTYRAQEMRLSIRQGTTFHRELPLAEDKVTGDPFDFTGWSARLDLYDADGTLVVSFADAGEDGEITLTNHGVVDLDLNESFIDAIVDTVEIAGVVHAPVYGQLVFTSPEGIDYDGPRTIAEIVRSPEP